MGHFRVAFEPHHESEAKCKVFIRKSFALSLAFTMRSLHDVTAQYSPGHSLSRQECCSNAGPRFEQSFPPAEGLGLEHVLCLDVTPGPQVRLHTDQSVQALKPPSTKGNQIRRRFINGDVNRTVATLR